MLCPGLSTWKRPTLQLISNQNAPIAIPCGTPDTQKARKPIPSQCPITMLLPPTRQQLNTPRMLPSPLTSYEDLPAKFLIRRTTINPRRENLKAYVFLLDLTAVATCPLCLKEERAVEAYKDTPTSTISSNVPSAVLQPHSAISHGPTLHNCVYNHSHKHKHCLLVHPTTKIVPNCIRERFFSLFSLLSLNCVLHFNLYFPYFG